MAPGPEQGYNEPSAACLCSDCLLAVLSRVTAESRPTLRLVCRRFRELVDANLCPRLRIDGASHLAGGRPTGAPVYPGSLHEFQMAAARVVAQRAAGLRELELDFDAYGCVFASALLSAQQLPQLERASLENAEAQHVAALRGLPRLREVGLHRRINGPVTASPAAELLVVQLSGLPLGRLHLGGYRMLPSVLARVADTLPALRHLALDVEQVEQHSGLDLGPLPRLARLASLELRFLPGRASAEGATLTPLPSEASDLVQLASVRLAHVRPAPGEEPAFWASLALLPALQELSYVESGHRVRGPPPQLLRLAGLTSLRIQIEGEVCSDDPPNSTWTRLPELPPGALPRLADLRVDSVGLLAFPASWCRLPLQRLRLSGRARERCFYSLALPDNLSALAPTLRRLELPCCGLLSLPEDVAELTGLTHLSVRQNAMFLLPPLGRLQQLQEIDCWGNPTGNAGEALSGCTALRRLVLGTAGLARRGTLDGGVLGDEQEEGWRWEHAWVNSVRAQLARAQLPGVEVVSACGGGAYGWV